MADSKTSLPIIDDGLETFLRREFGEALAAAPDGPSRRRFLQLMGASLALAGVTGCRRELANIMPESRRPQGHVPGALTHFTTALELGGAALPLLATSYEGRPIKLDGNASHPASGGGSSLWAQASILELYDPDRSGTIVRRGAETGSRSWDEFASFARTTLATARERHGAGLAVLAEPSSSPTLASLHARLTSELPEARWFEYEPLSRDSEREGARLAFGRPLRPVLELERARVVLCVDADLLEEHPDAVRHARAWATRRNPTGEWMSRWYSVESAFSLTGATADHRLPLRSAQLEPFLLALEAELRRRLGSPAAAAAPAGGFLTEPRVARFLAAVAEDLASARGASLVGVGPRQSAEVHALAFRVNALLGNVGGPLTFVADPEPARPSHLEAIKALVESLNAGRVETLVILGGNPVYDAPADLELAGAIAKAKESLHLSLYDDETSAVCSWHLPRSHFLESWGDARTWDGTVVLQQPLVEPLFGGKSILQVLGTVLGAPSVGGLELVRGSFDAAFPGGEARWRKALKDGFVEGSAPARVVPTLASFELSPVAAEALEPRGLELVFTHDHRLYDGRFANNGWLQEQPDTIGKLTWDNAAYLAPATAAELGVQSEDQVELELRGRKLVAPVWVVPGLAAGTISLALGGGRTASGQVGGLAGHVTSPGVDAYKLRSVAAFGFGTGLVVRQTGGHYPLATTQQHYEMDAIGKSGRTVRLHELVRRGTLGEYKHEPDFAQHVVEHPPLLSLWQEPGYEGHRWGMAIDVNACIGCGACSVACQAENNVPVVGKEQVRLDREMHWLRVDRYFEGGDESPAVTLQPVTCQHCETAPCESVCPVAATVHSDEGLNEQVYNRCVGTRYCANNCPYKVRRFNYVNYHKDLEEPRNEVKKMVYNPDVTVRSRGVMEKCTFCVQRIERVKITARNDKRAITDGEIMPACALACPTHAIHFGDLNDTRSDVRQAHADPRAYGMLAELNTKPRNAYLARIKNPHPSLEPAAEKEHG
jgi:Fe-S-cluster-containing dehydrogenase component/anaerobic selenocysteine-containing dehydrogenase